MKAWRVSDEAAYENGCIVVFAETRGKAHALAMHTDFCEYAEWNDIRVTRLSAMDYMYKPGKVEMDWYNAEDRIALVKECGWSCLPDWLDMANDCPACPAAEHCDYYQDWKTDMEEERNEQM